jgi:hypothetical protein
MTHHLAWIESRGVTNSSAMQLEANALRRDTAEAQTHIDRLYRRYLNGAERRILNSNAKKGSASNALTPLAGRTNRPRDGRRCPSY